MKEEKINNEIIIYTSDGGQAVIDVRIDGETVWLTQAQLAELFGTTKQNISLHIINIFDEGELSREATVKEYLIVQKEGGRAISRKIEHYNQSDAPAYDACESMMVRNRACYKFLNCGAKSGYS